MVLPHWGMNCLPVNRDTRNDFPDQQDIVLPALIHLESVCQAPGIQSMAIPTEVFMTHHCLSILIVSVSALPLAVFSLVFVCLNLLVKCWQLVVCCSLVPKFFAFEHHC